MDPVRWIDAHPGRAALLLGFACILPAIQTARLFTQVRPGLTELLPRSSRTVQALKKLDGRIGGESTLYVVAESPHPDANRRFILDLGERLEARHIPEAKWIETGCWQECPWVRDRALMLLPRQEFDSLTASIGRVVRIEKASLNPLFVDLVGDSPAAEWRRLETKVKHQVGQRDRFPHGFFELPDGTRVVAMIVLQGSSTEIGPPRRLLDAVQREVAAIRPKYPTDLVVGYNGEVVNVLEEHDAILGDLVRSSVIVALLVSAAIYVYFRSVRGLVCVLFALMPGLLITFALGLAVIGHLNSNTAFLGSIIAGNGINYPLMYLAFYRRTREPDRAAAIKTAAKQAFAGTLSAALTASAAYGALASSSMRGFSQFAWIGGMGMVSTWLFTFLSMPIGIALLNPPRAGAAPSRAESVATRFFQSRVWPPLAAAVFLVVAFGAAGAGVAYAKKHGVYEMDWRVMRNRASLRHGSAFWEPKVGEVFGMWMNPVAVLVDDPAHREQAASALRSALVEGDAHVAERVETIQNWDPPVAEQRRRIAVLERLAKSLGELPAGKLPTWARPYVARWLAPAQLRVVRAAEVPEALSMPYQEKDGRTDRAVSLFPSSAIDYYDGRNIVRFADELANVPLPSDAVAGGGFLFMAEIIRVVRDEAPRVVVVALAFVGLALTFMSFRRPRRIAFVMATVVTVTFLAQAAMLGMHVQVNTVNFAALPITLGVGADYAVNLFGAMDALGVGARRACARMGGAILLCSGTTVIGYVSLLLAQSGALRSFGWAAVLGELASVTTVLLVLPVLLSPLGPLRRPHAAPHARA